MRIMLTTWQLSRCPLLRRGGQVRVLQKVLNRFNGHRLQWFFGQRPSHTFSLLNEIGYFAIKFRHKASHLIFVALGNKFCRFPDVMPSLSDVLFICNLFYRSSRPSTTILANKFPKRVPAPEYVGGGEAEAAGDVVQRWDHQVVKVRAPRPGREKEAWARICVHQKVQCLGGGDV